MSRRVVQNEEETCVACGWKGRTGADGRWLGIGAVGRGNDVDKAIM